MFFVALIAFLVGVCIDIYERTEYKRAKGEHTARQMFGWFLIAVGVLGVILAPIISSSYYETNITLDEGEFQPSELFKVGDEIFEMSADGSVVMVDNDSHDEPSIKVINAGDTEVATYEVYGDISHTDLVYGFGGSYEVVREYIFYLPSDM